LSSFLLFLLAGSKRSRSTNGSPPRSQEHGLCLSSATPASSPTPIAAFSLPSGGSGSGGVGGSGTGGAAGGGNGGAAGGSGNGGATGGQQGTDTANPIIVEGDEPLPKGKKQKKCTSAHLMYGSILPRRGWSSRTMGRHMFSCGLIAISQDASTRADVRAIMEQRDFGPI
jgi:hypothetical protein